jgi:hypothetical protein
MLRVLIDRLIGADRARGNALVASRRLRDARRQREEVDAYLASVQRADDVRPGAA